MPEYEFDIFISHAHPDIEVAQGISKYLEERKLRCWIAPRNISPGRGYAVSIIEGIKSSAIMIVVFDDHANNSPHVQNEVERAFSLGLQLIPFRIHNVHPQKSLEYFLSATHWLDAFRGDPEDHFETLYLTCCKLLTATPVTRPGQHRSRSKLKIPAIIAGCLIVLGLAIGFFLYRPAPIDIAVGLYPITSLRLLTQEDIKGKNSFELRLMRNEIFARHGYVFKTYDLKTHFSSQKWYKPNPSLDTSTFSFIEKMNINFIKSFEK